jgi:hypothetical protein
MTIKVTLLGLAAGIAMLAPALVPAGPAAAATFTASTATAKATVILPTVITEFKVSLSQFGQLSYSGCLGLPSGVTTKAPTKVPGLVIQYTAERGGTWHRLGSAVLTGHGCGNEGEAFAGSLGAKLSLAYYRAYFPGGTGAQGTRYAAAHSQTLLAWKLADRITSFAVSAKTVAKGHSLTVRGVLQDFHGGWHGYAGQHVLVIFRFKGSDTWYYIAQPKTDSAGSFSATFTDPGSATWAAEYLGDSTHLAAVSAMIPVSVQ